MDTVYPEPMSRLHRRVVPRKRKGGSFRYRTQPVTFSEIQMCLIEVRGMKVPIRKNQYAVWNLIRKRTDFTEESSK
ncbi:unnamed protein product [Callosobruchus maculatus]|uniref:Uncharacterized protein n=1 Tax=Callosobruchus maculatus TaxID=64391 RepID=A0A653BXU2_CALMS|nr:unnamed protein product [Callosobruchus maculatus]